MKTALDLPDELMREVKIVAARRGRKLKDLIAELLRAGLNAPERDQSATARFVIDRRTGLPVVVGTRPATPNEEMTPERVAEILSAQDRVLTS